MSATSAFATSVAPSGVLRRSSVRPGCGHRAVVAGSASSERGKTTLRLRSQFAVGNARASLTPSRRVASAAFRGVSPSPAASRATSVAVRASAGGNPGLSTTSGSVSFSGSANGAAASGTATFGSASKIRQYSDMSVGVPKETFKGERRVAMAPETCAKLVKAGFRVVVEKGAGKDSEFDDDEYVGRCVVDARAAGTRLDQRWRPNFTHGIVRGERVGLLDGHEPLTRPGDRR